MPESMESSPQSGMETAMGPAVTAPLGEALLGQVALIDLMFFAYRDFTAEADRALERMDYGRAHHRALYFINRKPGMMVAELLDILSITKQSLSRVLRQMIDDGYIVQHEGETDRRQRLVFPTGKGRKLLLSLSTPQSQRISNALLQTLLQAHPGMDADQVSRLVGAFLTGMMDSGNLQRASNLW